jgi:hypothetical protein
MSVKISRAYKDATSALGAIGDLEAAGLRSEGTVVTINADTHLADTHVKDPSSAADKDPHRAPAGKAGPMATAWEILAVVGLAILAVICVALMAIPGLGAIVGGLIVGGLIQHAMSRNTADDPRIRRGGVLVTARVPDAEQTRYQDVLDRTAAAGMSAGAGLRLVHRANGLNGPQ